MRRSALLLAPALVLAGAPGAEGAARAPAPQLRLAVSVPRVSGRAVALAGQGWRIVATARHYVAGQTFVVSFRYGRRHVKTETVLLRPGPSGTGSLSVPYRLARPGRVRVYVTHAGTALLPALRAAGRVDVIAPSASFGQGGLRVAYLQQRLRSEGFAVPLSGHFDDATSRAVVAFRKVNGMARNDVANGRVFRQLARGRGAFRAKFPGHGRHLEADLGKQVLALVDPGGRVRRVYVISSGKPSTPTVLGSFFVYSKTPGYNSLGMLDSNYFIDGYAVHGYHDVPTFAASHGCIRAPIPDAAYLFGWIRYGTRIDVYERGKAPGSVRVRHRGVGP